MTQSQKQSSHNNNPTKAVRRYWSKVVFLNRLRKTRIGAVVIKLALKRLQAARRFLRTAMLLNRLHVRQMGVVAISLALCILLVVAYFFAVLRWLSEPLARLFQENLAHYYALVSVLLIFGQGILLSLVTSGLLRLGKLVNGRGRD